MPIPSQVLGPRGPKGWTPTFTIVADGAYRRVVQIDWQGGANPKPAVGYIGTGAVGATAAEAADVAGLKITSMVQQPDYSLLVTFHDGSTYSVPNFFTDMVAKADYVAANYPDIVAKHNSVVSKHGEVVSKHSEVEAKRVEINGLVGQAAGIVFSGSTDFPTQPPLSYWHCDMGELEPTVELAYTGNLSVTDQRGVLRSVPAAARPLNYDPITKACLGFPMWEGRTNYFTNSNNPVGASVTLGTDGTVKNPSGGNALKVITTGELDPRVYRTSDPIGNLSNRTFTFSVWLWVPPSIGTTKAMIYIFGNNGAEQLAQRVVDVTSVPTRFSITQAFGAGMVNTTIQGRFDPFEGDVPRGSNTPTAGLEMFYHNFVVEEGAFATPDIPTVSGVLGRGNTLPAITGLAFQRDFGPTEGTVVLEFLKDTGNTKIATLANMYDTGGVRTLWLEIITNNGMALRSGSNHGNIVLPSSSHPVVVNGRNKVAFSYRAGRMAFCLNGGTVFTSNAFLLPLPLNRFDFCLNGYILNNHVREKITYNYVVGDAHLVSLSRL